MRNTAATVRANKERWPKFYCSNPRCLFRTFSANTGQFTPCPKHERKAK